MPKPKLALPDRFWRHVIIGASTDCWIWKRPTKLRYPAFRITATEVRQSSRVAYELTYGQSPPNKEVCHTCDNTQCVNPRHLFLGSHKQNMQDALKKGRLKLPEPKRKLTPDDVRRIRALAAAHIPYREIADVVGISKTMAYQIAKGKWWRHVLG